MDNVAVELSFVSFGGTGANASGIGKYSGTATTTKTTIKSKGPTLDLVGTLPITKEFGLLGRVGIHRWYVESSATSSSGTNVDIKDTKPGFTIDHVGFGAKYSLNKTMDVRAEWELFKDVGDTLTTGQVDVRMMTLGLVYKF